MKLKKEGLRFAKSSSENGFRGFDVSWEALIWAEDDVWLCRGRSLFACLTDFIFQLKYDWHLLDLFLAT